MGEVPRTAREQGLADILLLLADGIDRLRTVPEGWEYGSLERLVLEHGEWYAPRPLPPGLDFGQPKACYRNSALVSLTGHGLDYVEGYGLTGAGVPMLHAWNAHPDTGEVYDTTWPWGESDDVRVEDGALLGIRFPRRAVLNRSAARDGEFSMLDCWMLRFPALALRPEGWQSEVAIERAYWDVARAYNAKHRVGRRR